MSVIERARAFCIAAHCAVGQKRKYTGEDYYHHPLEVERIIRAHSLGWHSDMLVAAILHDVVEDTKVPLHVIMENFGALVADYVEQLTDVSKPEDGNRAARKAIDLAHTAMASPYAKTIKLADLISNTRSIVARDPVFAKTYLAEKKLLLEVLRDGDSALYDIAYRLAYSEEEVKP